MKIKANGATISVNPRSNGGISIEQGSSHVLLTEDEWHLVKAAAADILSYYEPSDAVSPAKARIRRYRRA